ncbi:MULTISPECIES: hypothetical protein [Vibrio]|uniref:Uncharacterized protein n=1 Tax=Vibrio jasicida TaxID=766224 RepID=A0AAU9QKH5_9VIBR|nr:MULTISPECIES: hypothetical protein [Vibrio]MCZ2803348.1 hypothetical protein [Vibrio alginolyticus]CAH1582625.1 hypothetical protein THF1A12_190006 [Vibrio jasicida]CAH1595975.1 hypothetical protein THF1C08_40005 [Vibrio jasicida]
MYVYNETTNRLYNNGVLVKDFSKSRVIERCDRFQIRAEVKKYCTFKFASNPHFMGA